MNNRPQCIIVTGRPGSGKTTLARLLADRLWMPLVSRDEIKEGYVNTFKVRHDQLPPDTNGVVSELFFNLVSEYLRGRVSVVIEAAFQHKVWEAQIPGLVEIADPCILVCSVDADVAARRHLQRGLDDPRREFYHGDRRVVLYRETGALGPPAVYVAPDLSVPTLHVSTEAVYVPSIEDIMNWIREGIEP